jgi:23S rRNA (cytosine1962-C5)-methyltransferase
LAQPVTITVSTRSSQRLARGYPWVFRSDVMAQGALAGLMAGETVFFSDEKGKILATGYAHPKTQLMGRVLAKGKADLNEEFFTAKFRAALDWRDALFGGQPYYRLIHADSDGLPGLVIDRFGDTLVVQVNSAGMEMLQPTWMKVLEKTVPVKNIVLKNDGNTRTMEGLSENVAVIKGQLPEYGRVPFIENDVQFYADVIEGQKTGWFYDQRPHRIWIAEKAKGKTLIDVFSHTGAFGVTAAAKGAAHVTCVDSSQAALDVAKLNAELNKVADKCDFVAGKAFDVLESLQGKSFDVVCVDPPAFVKTKKDMAVGLAGYEKLARLAAPLVRHGGILFYASCSSHPNEAEMLDAILKGTGKAGREASLVYTGTAGPDHPMHPQLPETRYLKAFAFRIW